MHCQLNCYCTCVLLFAITCVAWQPLKCLNLFDKRRQLLNLPVIDTANSTTLHLNDSEMEAAGKTDEELYEVVKQSLKDNSLWNSLISNVEAEVIKLFEEKSFISTDKKKPQKSEITELINKLIIEYMDWMGYKLTKSLFTKESGTEITVKNNRKLITSLLDLEDNDNTLRLPLLTVLITMFKNKNEDEEALDN